MTGIRLYTPSEITDFYDISFFYEYVLRLNIPMYQTLFVHIVNARTHLDKEVKGRVLTQGTFFTDQVEQIWLGGVLKAEVDLLFVLETGVEAAEVLVVQAFLDADFAD